MSTQFVPRIDPQLAGLRADLPPPLYLIDRGHLVGWVREDTLGFRGFVDEREAMNAAWIVHRSISRKLARLHASRPTPIDIEPLSIVRTSQRDLIATSTAIVAELLRPGEDSPSGAEWFGFEIVVVPSVSEAMMRQVARVANHALWKSGTQWGLLGRGSRRRRSSQRGTWNDGHLSIPR
jgi:hypothetical protein